MPHSLSSTRTNPADLHATDVAETGSSGQWLAWLEQCDAGLQSMGGGGLGAGIAASDIAPAPSFGAKIRADFIEGIGKVAGKFVILLNVNNVLSMQKIGAMGQAAAAAADVAVVG